MKVRSIILAVITLCFSAHLLARGKNKIPYENFDWKIYQSDHFKVYYYSAEKHLMEEMVDMSEAAYKSVSEKLQHELNFLVPILFFKTHEEFEQTNVFPGFVPRAIQGFSEPFQSRIVMPIDGTPKETYALLSHELTHIFQYDMLYNNRISTIIRANAPTWFTEGMASYVSDDEENLDQMVLRDVAVNGGFGSLGNFQNLSFIAYRVGHAAFDYIEQEYGVEGVRNLLWQYRKNVTGSITTAIERAFEINIVDFDRGFRKYLRRRYIDLLPIKEEPDDFSREIRTRESITTLSPQLSPSGDLFAAIIPVKNEIDLVLISTKDGRIFKNLTKGHTSKFTEINVGAFRGVNDLSWSKDGNEILFTARKEGTNGIYLVNVLKGKISAEIKITDIRDAQAPVFSLNGDLIYFVGNRDGRYDIYSYNRKTKAVANLTEDDHHDRNPRLSPDGKELLYSSRRDGFYKIFTLKLDSGAKQQLTSGLGDDIQASYSTDMKSIYFSSDRFDDIYNIYQLELETGIKKQYTNILTGAFSPQERILFDHKESEERRQLIFTAYYQGRYRVYRMDKPEARETLYDVEQDNYSNVKQYDMSSNIQLDPQRHRPYKFTKNFSISNASVSVGATDDGRFISNTSLVLGDVVGNHLVTLRTYSVSSLESYFVSYLDRSKRLQWGASFSSDQSFFVDRFTFQQRQERTYKVNKLSAFARYPFTIFSRLEVGVGMSDEDTFRFVPIEGSRQFSVENADFTEPFAYVALSRDSVRYKKYGPQRGMLLDLAYQNTFNQRNSFTVDFRAYRELTARSLVAFRTLGNYSEGDIPDLHTLGGNNLLRGDYDYYEFVGSRRVLTQLELRFPLIDSLRGPGFAFGGIRGAIFLEAGGTWVDDDDFSFEFQESPPEGALPGDPRFFNSDNPDPNFLIGAVGTEISMSLFGLELHWTWAKRTNFEDIPSGNRFSFWIGSSF